MSKKKKSKKRSITKAKRAAAQAMPRPATTTQQPQGRDWHPKEVYRRRASPATMTEQEQVKRQVTHFAKFNGMRPRSIDPRYPVYDPGRDFGQVLYWLNTIRSVARSESATYWKRVMQDLSDDPDDVRFEDNVHLGLQAIERFLVDARGGLPLSVKDWSSPSSTSGLEPNFCSIEDAMARFRELPPSQAVPVLGMLGACAIDMLFFAARQDLVVGREGPYTMEEMLPAVQRLAFDVWDGKTTEQAAADGLVAAGRACRLAGLSDEAVRDILDSVLTGRV